MGLVARGGTTGCELWYHGRGFGILGGVLLRLGRTFLALGLLYGFCKYVCECFFLGVGGAQVFQLLERAGDDAKVEMPHGA